MSLEILLLLGVIGSIIVLFFFIRKQRPSEELLEWLKSTNSRMDEQGKAINERLDNAAKFIAAVQRNIGEMTEIGRGMKELQDFLKSPKLRGNISEQILKDLLGQLLPKQSFSLQFMFKTGSIVDAAIKTEKGIIPIDAKFPLENFRKLVTVETEAEKKTYLKDFERDVKKHIEDIARKYILTDEGTIDYALMYLPSESVYYEVINNPVLFDFSQEKRVLPVSPTTLYAYIKTILMSLEGQKIEKEARRILSSIRAIQKDYEKVEENLGVLNKHLTNAYNQMAQVVGGFTVLGQKFSSVSKLEIAENKKQNQLKLPNE